MRIEDFKKLAEPFPAEDIDWRVAQGGFKKDGTPWAKVLAYITSRAVQQRLDDVCGPDGWQTELTLVGNNTYLCKLSIRVDHEDGTSEWISRMDGSDESNVEAVKGGISGAIKRAAVQFGVGRYLYKLKDNFAIIKGENEKFSHNSEINDKRSREKKWVRWDPPALPSWALPSTSKRQTPKPSVQASNTDVSLKDKEIDSLISQLKKYINDGVIPENVINRAQSAIDNRNYDALKAQVEWCSNKIDATIANEAAHE